MLPCLSRQPHAAVPLNIIREGDEVVIYESPLSMKAVIVKTNGRYDSKFGAFVHNDWIGRPFGSKVTSQHGRGWCYLLKPTVDLWSLVVRHRTQILYIADISLICMNLELRPGQVVLESGTGSASLTHSLCRSVAPTGHVYTYEFHPERADAARKELNDHGLASVVTVTQRDIMENGFPTEVHGPILTPASDDKEVKVEGGDASSSLSVVRGVQPSGVRGVEGGDASSSLVQDPSQLCDTRRGLADAVFLDLPGPWKVVANAAACLAPNGRFCSFSPCIEQVQRTSEALAANGFTDINTIEVLLREYELKMENFYQTTDEVLARSLLPKAAYRDNANSKAGRQGQGQGQGQGQVGIEPQVGIKPEVVAMELEEGGKGGDASSAAGGNVAMNVESSSLAKRKREEEGEEALEGEDDYGEPMVQPSDPIVNQGLGGPSDRSIPMAPPPPSAVGPTKVSNNLIPFSSVVTTRPVIDARGHTGYLTFARKFV